MRDEVDPLGLHIHDFEDQLRATEMSCYVNNESLLTLKELPGAGERLSKQVVDMRGRVAQMLTRLRNLRKG